MIAPGPKALQIRRLRELRAAGNRAPRIIPTEALASKPNNAPVKASAPPQEKMMKKKLKKAKAPKRSMSEAAANLRAAKAAGKTKRAKATVASGNGETKAVRSGSKLEIVKGLLTRSEGCTTKEVLEATGWPSVSMPQMAKAAGLTLSKEKDGSVSRYRGVAA